MDARAGECAERLAGRTDEFKPDRAAQLAALERAGDGGAERTVGRGHPEAGRRDRALSAQRVDEAGLER